MDGRHFGCIFWKGGGGAKPGFVLILFLPLLGTFAPPSKKSTVVFKFVRMSLFSE
jgi:hypothetical protein